MFLQLFLSALALGALSSFHCVGMCGAIAFSLPTNNFSARKKLGGILLYNAGRITLYSFLGLIFGVVGRQISLGGFQQTFSVIAGILILIIVVQSFIKKKLIHIKTFDKLNLKLQQFIGVYVQRRQLYGMFLLGIGNGLLPCGMVYLAITGALATGSIGGGIFFMASFGLGTFPAMFMLSYFGFVISLSARNAMKKAVPYVVVVMGVLLILRGMGIGVFPMNSFFTSENVISCH